MANPHKGEVEFVADGKTYIAAFTANVMAQLDDAIDADAFARFVSGGASSALILRKVFWLAVRARHSEIDAEEKAGDLVGYHEMAMICREGLLLATGGPDALKAFNESLVKQQKSAEEGDPDQPSPPKPDQGPSGGEMH